MKRMLTFALTLCLMLSLAACGQKNSGKQETTGQDQTVTEEQTNQAGDQEMDSAEAQDSEMDAQQDAQTIKGVVNRLDDYLVLLDENGDYHTFDYGVDVDPTTLEEGDQVTVTYNGTLDGDDSPVAVSIDKVVS